MINGMSRQNIGSLKLQIRLATKNSLDGKIRVVTLRNGRTDSDFAKAKTTQNSYHKDLLVSETNCKCFFELQPIEHEALSVKTTHERCGPFSLVVLSQRRGRVTTSSGPTLSETLLSKASAKHFKSPKD